MRPKPLTPRQRRALAIAAQVNRAYWEDRCLALMSLPRATALFGAVVKDKTWVRKYLETGDLMGVRGDHRSTNALRGGQG